MANSFALAQNYLADPSNLNAVYKEASKTAILEADRVQFEGANVVKLPKIAFGAGLGDYSRTSGYVGLDSELTWDTYTLSQDKGNKLPIDVMDLEETKQSEGIIKFVNEYVRQVVVPAIDTYRFGKLASGAGTTKALTLDASNVVDELLTADAAMTEAEVPEEGRLIFMSATKLQLLQSSSDISKYISYGMYDGKINNKVVEFNGAKIITVPQARLGTDTQFLYVHPSAILTVVKHNPTYIVPRGQHTDGDFDVALYRMYHDLFVVANKTKGIYLQTVTA